MRTAEQKVTGFCREMGMTVAAAKNWMPDLLKLIKEQDRDTRHACTEAVEQACNAQGVDSSGIAAACMNARGL
jgi:hypothetical protein